MPFELDNEIALVRLAQSGSTESFEILVNRYEERIYRLVRTVTKNDQDAEDVLQETFLKAYVNIHHFNGESRFYTWLVNIAINEILLKIQHRGVHAGVSLDEAASTGEDRSSPREIRGWHNNPEEIYTRPKLFAILCNALVDLAPLLRAVFALRDIEGFSPGETASVLGLSVQAVKTHLTRARLELRENLSVWFEDLSVPAAGQGGCESVGHFLGVALAEDRECT